MLKPKVVLLFLIFILALSACTSATALPTSIPTSKPTEVPTVEVIPTTPPTQANNLPQTDAEVPRVNVDVAKAAFDSGQAIIVDVRAPQAYESSHVKGAINIPLGTIQTD